MPMDALGTHNKPKLNPKKTREQDINEINKAIETNALKQITNKQYKQYKKPCNNSYAKKHNHNIS